MRVALDATPLSLSTGGLRRYVEELARALLATFPEDAYLLVSDQPFETATSMARGRLPGNALERKWWSYGLPRELARRRIDVFHGTNFEVPCVPLRPSVITVHDLSPWRDEPWRAGGERVRRRTPFLVGLGLATMVITVSEAIRRETIERFSVAPERVVAVPLAAAPHLKPVESPRQPPYFAYVGSIEPRKNVETIVAAWREVRRKAPVDLVVAGPVRGVEIEPEPGLKLLGEVPESALAPLFSGAVACLFPSLYEGFGLPVLEAMQCGAPVIVSRDPALTEVAEGGAVQVDARDVRGWADAMFAAVSRPEWRAEWSALAMARARQFSWDDTARKTRDVYSEAIRRHHA
ncbi:MAG TPA: glycosyltransferase family 1 protein [Bryobacteraceae bacterium]|nr:glycosyltransferase family 1 protein [Bryobacteraceae bacterium]